jgi:hypothetical protein
MADLKMTLSNAAGEKEMEHETSVTVLTEYDEYLGLCETMTDEKLKKLIRKIEYALCPKWPKKVLTACSLRVLPQLIVLYLMSYVDRTNVGKSPHIGTRGYYIY